MSRSLYDRDGLLAGPLATNTDDERRRAARHVASHACDAADLAEVLAMLGLEAHEGKNTAADQRVSLRDP